MPKEEYPELYNTYSTYLYSERASTILDDYAVGNNAKPFFMYLATQSIHDPLEVPIEYEEMYPDSNDSQLRKVKMFYIINLLHKPMYNFLRLAETYEFFKYFSDFRCME